MYLREVDEKILGAGAGGIAGAALGAYLARRKNSRFERKKTQRDRLMKYVGVGGVAGSAVGAGLGAIYQKFANKKNPAYEKALAKAAQDIKNAEKIAKKDDKVRKPEDFYYAFQISSQDLNVADKFIDTIGHKFANIIKTETTLDKALNKEKELSDKINVFLRESFKYGTKDNDDGLKMLLFALLDLTYDMVKLMFVYLEFLQDEMFNQETPKDYKKKFIKLYEKVYPKILKSNLRQFVTAYHATIKKNPENPHRASMNFLKSDTLKELKNKNKRELEEITNKTFNKT